MRLYKTSGDSDEGWKHKWSGTQKDATEDRKALKADGFVSVDTKEVDVPTDKPGLLAWLNANVSGE